MTIRELLSSLKANLNQTDITLYPGASEQQIREFEEEMQVVLPDDFRTFYSFCNGFESEEDLFRMIPLEEILDQKQEFKPQQFYIAEYLIYCDMWHVELTNQPSVYRIAYMDVTLTDSLVIFLSRFLQGGVFNKTGLYDWHEEARALRN